MKSPGIITCLIVLGACLASSPAEACGRGSIIFLNNEYKQMLVAISDNVPEDPQIITRIKEVFTEASAFLYQATRNRAVFRAITILVPKSWTHQPDWEPVSNEQIDKSDILIDLPDPAQTEPHKPFVIKTTPCGQLGYYMHLTPTYLLDESVASKYGPYDKVIVHEWAHLRYGVYDEYPTESGNDHFYATSAGKFEATRCSLALTGRVHDEKSGGSTCSATTSGTVDPGCKFEDDTSPSDPGEEYGSLMYRPHLGHISAFCDNDVNDRFTLHNSESPTQQNKMCGSRSVWEVMRAHPDFIGDANPPDDLDSQPEFKVVQDVGKRYALILDVSGSMKDNDRKGILNQGCNNFVMSLVQDGEEVGIVTFNDAGKIVQPMTVVNDQTRAGIVANIPNQAKGATSIGAGVRKGIQMLNNGGGTAGATCIVVSDGDETTKPWVRDVLDEVEASGMTCHTIGITNDAALTMEELATRTGGLSFLYSESSGSSNGINEAFTEIAQLGTSAYETKYTLASEAQTLPAKQVINETIVIDDTLGRDTEFIVDYAQPGEIEVEITAPSGVVYGLDSIDICETQASAKIFKCVISGMNETGSWRYLVRNTYNGNQRIAVGVSSKASKEGEYPLLANAVWAKSDVDVSKTPPDIQSIYASVSKGHVAVLNAQVMAEVETPGGAVVKIELEDSGAGADLNKDDGVYSAYYMNFDEDKRYTIKVKVDNTPATVVSPGQVVGTASAPIMSAYSSQLAADIPTGDFQRLATGGSFILSGVNKRQKYLPGPIYDFRLTSVMPGERQGRVAWTATGSELDTGTVSSYDIRYSEVFAHVRDGVNYTLVNDSMLVLGEGENRTLSLADPQSAGYEESFLIQFPEDPEKGEEVTYYLAVMAHVAEGRDVTSGLSNIISISMTPLESSSDSSLGLILGIVFGIIGLLILIGVILAIVFLRRPCGTSHNLESTLDGGETERPPPSAPERKHWEVKETAYYRSGDKPIVVTTKEEANVYENTAYGMKM